MSFSEDSKSEDIEQDGFGMKNNFENKNDDLTKITAAESKGKQNFRVCTKQSHTKQSNTKQSGKV